MDVLVADTSVLFREGIKAILSHKYSGLNYYETDNAKEFIDCLQRQSFDLIVLDPKKIEQSRVKDYELQHKAKVISISSELSRSFILSVLQNGVNACLTKDCSEEEIIQAIESTKLGERFFCNKVLDSLLDNEEFDMTCDPTVLTKREIEIVQLICDGLTTIQIAAELNLSKHTVNTHRKNIMGKLHFKTPAELIRYAIETSLIAIKS